MKNSLLSWGCVVALLMFPAWLAAGCESTSNGRTGGAGGTGGVAGSGGSGGTGGSTADCTDWDTLEANETYDEATGIASGTVNASCEETPEGGDDCTGPDQVDDWDSEADMDGTYEFKLTWSDSSVDLDLEIVDPRTCDVLAVSESGEGTEEIIQIDLTAGTWVWVSVLPWETNGAAAPYTLE
jgi:hypothetical protein